MSRDTGADFVAMDGNSLLVFQTKAGATQAEMASAMQVPLRTYEDIIAGRSQVRGVHIQAAEFGLLLLALKKRDPSILSPALANMVLDLAKMLEAEANKKPVSPAG